MSVMALLKYERSNFSSVPLCKDRSREDWGCGDYIAPSNDLVFLHVRPFRGMEDLCAYGQVLFNAPGDIFLWNRRNGTLSLCRETDHSLLGGPSLFREPRIKWGSTSWY
jgi:hypothetical protein